MSGRYLPGKSHQLPRHRQPLAHYQGQFIRYEFKQSVATITLNRPEKKNPLTFDSYAELRDLFRAMTAADDVHAIVIRGDGQNFCSGGDVHEIIGPLTELDMPGLLAFTRMTGDVVKAMRACPSRSSRPSMASAQARAPCWPWVLTCDWALAAAKPISSLIVSGSRAAIWGPVHCCPVSLARAGLLNYSTPAAASAARRQNAGDF